MKWNRLLMVLFQTCLMTSVCFGKSDEGKISRNDVRFLTYDGFVATDIRKTMDYGKELVDLLQSMYIKGYLDALQMSTVARKKPAKMLDEFKGMSVEELRDSVASFYQKYPELKDKYSVPSVLSIGIPNQRKGKEPPPLSPEGTVAK